MVRHSPQEIADFFGVYVAQDQSGEWGAYNYEPKLIEKDGELSVWGTVLGAVWITYLVDTPENHDFHILYEPSKPDKAPHQSEVHTHKEYIIVGGCNNRISLEKDIGNNINNGWKLLGGVAVDDGLFYQAMVRGV